MTDMLGLDRYGSLHSEAPPPSRRERWLALRDLLAGALLLAAWLALWTVTWAAVAGPLRPGDAARAEAAATATRA
jgi:hypothetical protein